MSLDVPPNNIDQLVPWMRIHESSKSHISISLTEMFEKPLNMVTKKIKILKAQKPLSQKVLKRLKAIEKKHRRNQETVRSHPLYKALKRSEKLLEELEKLI